MYANARLAPDIGDLVRVGDHGCGAPGHDCARVLGDGDHGALDMNVAVDESRREDLAVQVQDLASAGAVEACYPAFMNGHIRPVHLAGEKVGHAAPCQEQIDLHFTARGSDQLFETVHANQSPLVIFKLDQKRLWQRSIKSQLDLFESRFRECRKDRC